MTRARTRPVLCCRARRRPDRLPLRPRKRRSSARRVESRRSASSSRPRSALKQPGRLLPLPTLRHLFFLPACLCGRPAGRGGAAPHAGGAPRLVGSRAAVGERARRGRARGGAGTQAGTGEARPYVAARSEPAGRGGAVADLRRPQRSITPSGTDGCPTTPRRARKPRNARLPRSAPGTRSLRRRTPSFAARHARSASNVGHACDNHPRRAQVKSDMAKRKEATETKAQRCERASQMFASRRVLAHAARRARLQGRGQRAIAARPRAGRRAQLRERA